jgi:hypothetical protein
MERGVLVAVHRAAVGLLVGEKITFRAGRRGAFHSVPSKNTGFRRHNATLSRVTV